MQRLPTDKKYKKLFDLIKENIPKFYEYYNENDRQFLLKEKDELLSENKQQKLLKMTRQNKSLQVALLYTHHISKLHKSEMLKDTPFFAYIDTKLESLKSGGINDDAILYICNALSLETLNNFFIKHIKGIDPTVFNVVAKECVKKINNLGKHYKAEKYELIALSKYNNNIVNQKIVRAIAYNKIDKDILTALINNENIPEKTRTTLSKRDYDIYNIETPPPELLNELYMSTVETIYDIPNSDKWPETEIMAETVLSKLICHNQLSKEMQMDLMCRIVNDDTFQNNVLTPILSNLIKNTVYSDVTDFYASGALNKPQEFRDLIFKKSNLPIETSMVLLAIIFDNIKEEKVIKDDEFDFVVDQIYKMSFDDNVYDRFFKTISDININDTKGKGFDSIEFLLKCITQNMAFSKHTPDDILDKLCDVPNVSYNGIAKLATLNKELRESFNQNLSEIFSLADALKFCNSLDNADKELFLKSKVKENMVKHFIDDIKKRDTLYDFYINLDVYVDELNKIEKKTFAPNKQTVEIIEEVR